MTTPKIHQPLSWRDRPQRVGKVAMTVKIRIDMPLPMPRSVISSPSHMIMAVPAVIVMTISRNVAGASLCSRRLVAALEQVAASGPA